MKWRHYHPRNECNNPVENYVICFCGIISFMVVVEERSDVKKVVVLGVRNLLALLDMEQQFIISKTENLSKDSAKIIECLYKHFVVCNTQNSYYFNVSPKRKCGRSTYRRNYCNYFPYYAYNMHKKLC